MDITELLDALTLYGKVIIAKYDSQWSVRISYGKGSEWMHNSSLEIALIMLLEYCRVVYLNS